jgi:hypothetical protein
MPIDFPSSPSVGQQYTYAGVTYVFTSQGVWSSAGTTFAPINSPVFTGDPQAPTQAVGDSDTSIATTAFVMAALATVGFTTGDIKYTASNILPTGWIYLDDTTIGSASSVATGRRNADCQALFTLLFNVTDDNACPVYSNGGALASRAAYGNNAATAWGGSASIALPRAMGRVFAVTGSGAGLGVRFHLYSGGAENITLVTGNLPSHNHAGYGGYYQIWPGSGVGSATAPADRVFDQFPTTSNEGGGSPIATLNPYVNVLAMIKL